jgi:hypothetical protein
LTVLLGFVTEGIAAIGGAENSAAARQDSADPVEGELKRFLGPDEAVEAIGNADDFPMVFEDGRFGGGANDSIEAGSVSASGGDADTTYMSAMDGCLFVVRF